MDILTKVTSDITILIYILIIIIVTAIVSKLITKLMERSERSHHDLTASYLVKDILTYSIYFVSLMYIFRLFGISLTGTLLSLGIVGIAVSFAAQDIISNLFSGIILILGKSIKVGDTVEIDGHKGTVERVSLRSTIIVDDIGVRNHVPNSTLTNNPYLEFNSKELRRVDIIAGLPLNIDVEEFKEYIIKKILTYDVIAESPEPNVFAKETSFKQVKVKVSFWVKDIDDENRHKLIIDNKEKYQVVIANDIRKYLIMRGEQNE